MTAYTKKIPIVKALKEIKAQLPTPTVVTQKELNSLLNVAPQLVASDVLMEKLKELGQMENFSVEVVTKEQLEDVVRNNAGQENNNNVIIPSIQDKIKGWRAESPESTRKLKN